MNKILLTGRTGFIGAELFKQLKLKKYFIHTSSRSSLEEEIERVKNFKINQIDNSTNWSEALKDVDCIIHCAGIANETNKYNRNDFDNYCQINVEGTRNLAYQAAAKGVKRFIFISSIKVNGEKTEEFLSFKNNDIPNPQSIYSISKWEAEKSLHAISKQTGLEIVIIRAPMVYGPGVKGNFLRLLYLIDKGLPLPLGGINNLRSFISLDNLVNLIICCINHPKAAGQTFLVSDGEDISTPDLLRKLSKFMKKSSRVFTIPLSLIQLICRVFGKSSKVEKLLSSLQIDSFHAYRVLECYPVISLDEGLEKTANWYLRNQ